jgi:hypothetical protein
MPCTMSQHFNSNAVMPDLKFAKNSLQSSSVQTEVDDITKVEPTTNQMWSYSPCKGETNYTQNAKQRLGPIYLRLQRWVEW